MSKANGLPPRMHLNHGRYYYSTAHYELADGLKRKQKMIPLSRHLDEALVEYEEILRAEEQGHDASKVPGFDFTAAARTLYNKTVRSARLRDIHIALTEQDVLDLGAANEWHCAVTGIPFDFNLLGEARLRPYAPSVDRTDSQKGYTRDNCRLVCVCVNLAMGQWGEQVLARIALAYIAKRPTLMNSLTTAKNVRRLSGVLGAGAFAERN